MNNSVPCRVCGNTSFGIFQGIVININVVYYECGFCGYVQTEYPHWLDLAYSSAINNSDTGILLRNQANARISLAATRLLGLRNGTVVDFAGGYGILVRLLRDYGIDALWTDQYCKNLFAIGFERAQEKADLITAFEVLEHFVNPTVELSDLFKIGPNLLVSTELIQKHTPDQSEWWYYGKEHGQHIGFFRLQTLEWLAEKNGKYLVSDGKSYHLFSEKKVNQIYFRIIVRLNKLMPLLARLGLKSKTLSDHKLSTLIDK